MAHEEEVCPESPLSFTFEELYDVLVAILSTQNIIEPYPTNWAIQPSTPLAHNLMVIMKLVDLILNGLQSNPWILHP